MIDLTIETRISRPVDEVFNEAQILAGLSHPGIVA